MVRALAELKEVRTFTYNDTTNTLSNQDASIGFDFVRQIPWSLHKFAKVKLPDRRLRYLLIIVQQDLHLSHE